ncbi:unnamed protein product, partial [Coccothraustes coccothraustes]
GGDCKGTGMGTMGGKRDHRGGGHPQDMVVTNQGTQWCPPRGPEDVPPHQANCLYHHLS